MKTPLNMKIINCDAQKYRYHAAVHLRQKHDRCTLRVLSQRHMLNLYFHYQFHTNDD